MDLVIVKEYNERYKGEMAVELLEQNEINAILISSDQGGARPHLGMVLGFKVQVKLQDYEKAKEIISVV